MKNREYLSNQCVGARSVDEMGTTGLVAWVLTGNGSPCLNRWERWNMALRIIKTRVLSPTLFAASIIAAGKRHNINLNRFRSAVAKQGVRLDLLDRMIANTTTTPQP